jgi:hypothetical protein
VPAELNSTVLLFGTNVPLFSQLPLTVNEFVPVIVSVAPAPIVISLQRAPAAPIEGEKGVPAEIVTLSVAVGGTPVHQLEPTNQSELVAPSHAPVAHPAALTVSIPVPAAK